VTNECGHSQTSSNPPSACGGYVDVTWTYNVTDPCGQSDNCEGQFTTFTQGGYGTSCNGNNPGCYRDANFAGAFPNGLVIGTHDGEFGEWVPVVQNRISKVLLVEGSQNQYDKLIQNYCKNSLVKMVKEIITPDGGEVEFFEGGAGYTNSVVERVIRNWETEEIKSTIYSSVSVNDLIEENFKDGLDWLHLDIEGLDAKLIMSMKTLPNFIIFEDHNLTQEEKFEIYDYLENRGFKTKSFGGICEAVRK
jgi:FkbM family methyltransferase